MAEDKKPQSIFQGVVDAINGGKKKTPAMSASAQFAPNDKGDLVGFNLAPQPPADIPLGSWVWVWNPSSNIDVSG